MVMLSWILGIVSVLGVGGAIAAFIFFPTVVAPIVEKVLAVLLACKPCLIAAALVAVALASFWYGRDGQYDRGHTAAIAEIAAEDAGALKNATAARALWKECKQKNGEWDQSTGECK